MVIFEPILPAVLFAIAWIWWSVAAGRKKQPMRMVERFLFLGGCFMVFCFYFIELPLNAVGFWAIADDSTPLNEAIRIVPFQQLIAEIKHLGYYFEIYPMLFGGAALMGLTINLAVKKPMSFKKNVLVAFLIPLACFAFHAIIRLSTGAMWKRADTTDIIWFMIFYSIGYGIWRLVARWAKKRKKLDK